MKFRFKMKQIFLYFALRKVFFLLSLIMFFAVSINAQNEDSIHPDWKVVIDKDYDTLDVKIGLQIIPGKINMKRDRDSQLVYLSIQKVLQKKLYPLYTTKLNGLPDIQFYVSLSRSFNTNRHKDATEFTIEVFTNKYDDVQFVNIGKERLELPEINRVNIYFGKQATFQHNLGIENLKFAVIGDNESFYPLLWRKKEGVRGIYYLEESKKGISCPEADDDEIMQYCFYALPELNGANIKIYSDGKPNGIREQVKSGLFNVANPNHKNNKNYFALISKDGLEKQIEIHHGFVNYLPIPVEKETDEYVKKEDIIDSYTNQESLKNIVINIKLNVTNAIVKIMKNEEKIYEDILEEDSVTTLEIERLDLEASYDLVIEKEGYNTHKEPLLTEEEKLSGQKEYDRTVTLNRNPYVTVILKLNVNYASVKIKKDGKTIKPLGVINKTAKFQVELGNAPYDLIIDREGYEPYKEILFPKGKDTEGKKLEKGKEYNIPINLIPKPFILKVLDKNRSTPIPQVSTQIHYKIPDSPIYSVLPDNPGKTGENGNVEIDGVARELSDQMLLVLSHNNFQTSIETFEIKSYEDAKEYFLHPKIDRSYKVAFDKSKKKSEVRFMFAKDPQDKEIMHEFNYHSNYTFPYIDSNWVYKEINFSLDNGFSVRIDDQSFITLTPTIDKFYDADIFLEYRNGKETFGYMNEKTRKLREVEKPADKVNIKASEEITNILIENIEDGELYTALKTNKGFKHPILERRKRFNLFAIDKARKPYYVSSWYAGSSHLSFDSAFSLNLKGIKLQSNFGRKFKARIDGKVDEIDIGIGEFRYSDDNGILNLIFEGNGDYKLKFSPKMNGYRAEEPDSSNEEVITLPILNAANYRNLVPQQIDFKVYKVKFTPIELNIVVRNFSGITNKVFRKELKHLIEELSGNGQWAKVNLYHAISSRTFKPILLEDLNSYFRDINVSSESKALGTFTTIKNMNNQFTEKPEKFVQVLYITPKDRVFSFEDDDYEKKLDKVSIFEIIQKDGKTVNQENFKKLADKMDGVYLQGHIDDLSTIHLE